MKAYSLQVINSSMDPLTYIGQLHQVVDDLVSPLEQHHAERLQCRIGCSSCCVDDISVFEVEAESIKQNNSELLQIGRPHPVGGCAFLDADGACRIYQHRPYVCRTQGLPLRWIEGEDGDLFEARDICPLNAEGQPLVELNAEHCWDIGPVEERLAATQQRFGEAGARVLLRSLFARPCL